MKPDHAEALTPSPDLSVTSLEMAVLRLGASWTYELIVSVEAAVWAKNMLRKLAAQTVDNPFTPYINMRTELSYRYNEWSIAANGRTVWSSGC